MGVPKLLTLLTPYGDRKPLDNARVIIDGPALAYHAVNLCLADPVKAAGRNHPLDQPTYGQLGQAAVAWLDELRGRGIQIQALYFDGHLPAAKRPVRLERSYRTSAQLKDVFVFYQRDNLPGFDVKGPRIGSLLPAPPFSVPAVLDALRQSAVYGPLTTVVPGEADTFCAEHARTHGAGGSSTVITSDSDLLVQDLGPDAEVVLFRDIDLRGTSASGVGAGAGAGAGAGPRKPLVVPTYALATIRKRLGLPANDNDDHKGLYGFAFELSMDPHLGVSELAERAKQGTAAAQFPKEYAEFAEQYAYPDRFVAAAKRYDLTGLDPRVSELVVQCLFPSEKGEEEEEGEEAEGQPGSGSIFVFAPPLLDSCTRANAWEASASLRICAFSLLHIMAGRRMGSSAVREYARMASMSSRGNQLDIILRVPELGRAVDALLALLRQIRDTFDVDGDDEHDNQDLQWATLASYLDIQWSRENHKESVVCLDVLRQETTPGSGVLDRVTWNAVHWLAQIQGTLYSLRILKQIAEFVRREAEDETDKTDKTKRTQLIADESLSAKLAALTDALSNVTPLPDYPTLRTLRDLPARLKAAGALELLAELAELPEPIKLKAGPGSGSGSGAKKNKNKGKSKKRKRSDQAPARAQATANPFAVLEGAE